MSTVKLDGRTFLDCAEARHAVTEIVWARRVLAARQFTMPNGRGSHVVAAEVIDAAEDALIAYVLVTG